MIEKIKKSEPWSDKQTLLISGVGVAGNVLLTLFVIYGLRPSSEIASIIAVFSVGIMIIGLITVVLSIIALIKVRLILKIIPILYIVLTAGMALLAYFNIWWLGY